MLWRFRAHPVTSAPGASEHMFTRTVAAELYYLNHIRSQAASAFGSQGRCSGLSAALCISGVQVLLGLVMGMVKSVSLISGLRDMLSALQQMFKLLMASLQYVVNLVLESTPSVLEIGACIFLVDNSTGCDPIRKPLAAFILFLAV